jgi:hypothetical protein
MHMSHLRLVSRIVAVLVGIAAIGKLFTLLGESKSISAPSQIISGLTNRQVYFVSVLIELGYVYLVFDRELSRYTAGASLWLASLFTTVQLSSAILSPGSACGCYGAWETWLPVSQNQFAWLAKSVIAVLIYVGIGQRVARLLRIEVGSDQTPTDH